jgi:hypothetical protein
VTKSLSLLVSFRPWLDALRDKTLPKSPIGTAVRYAGSDGGGRTAAIHFSLTACAKRHDLDPFAWLRDLLTRLGAMPAFDSRPHQGLINIKI